MSTSYLRLLLLIAALSLASSAGAQDPPCGNPPSPPDPCEGLEGEDLECCLQNQGGGGGGDGTGGEDDSSGTQKDGDDPCKTCPGEGDDEGGEGDDGPPNHCAGMYMGCSGSEPGEPSANPVDPYSGSVGRRVDDLVLAHNVGRLPMAFTRHFASRWDPNPYLSEYDRPFGDGGNWRHSYQWTILDNGTNAHGRSIQIVYPNGRYGNFAYDSASALHMTFLASTHERVLAQGTNHYLMMLDGTQYHFTSRTNPAAPSTGLLYRMAGVIDAFSNRYTLTYSNDLLAGATGPNSNQFFALSYATATNSQEPGSIEFTHADNVATQVLLAGSFNGWSGEEMAWTNGAWSKAVVLTSGFHQYKFIVRYDGDPSDHWVADADNPLYVLPDSNSVAVISSTPVTATVLQSVTASDGRTVAYQYTSVLGTNDFIHTVLTNAVYGGGNHAAYTYYHPSYDRDRRPLLQTADDPHYRGPGRSIRYIYQTNNLFSAQLYEERSLVTDELLTRIEIDPAHPTLRVVTHADGSQSSYGYSTNTGRMLAFTNAVGYPSQGTYELIGGSMDGMRKSVTDPQGKTLTYTRTLHFGVPTEISNSVRGVRRIYYSDTNYPFFATSIVSYAAHTNVFVRDDQHRVTRRIYPDGTDVTNAYNAYGQLIARKHQDGAVWTYEYDDRGRMVRQTDPLGHDTWFSYDTYDRRATVSNALGYVTSYFYDWRGLVTNMVYPDGTSEIIRYDRYGDVTSRTDRASSTTVRTYDSHGRLTSVRDALDNVTAYQHDIMGRLITHSNALGLTVSNTYDAIGRRIRETFSSDGTYNEWRYDPDGVRTQINRVGGVSLYFYRDEGWIEKKTDPLGLSTSYGYDAAGNATTVTNALGGVMHMTYDALGRRTSTRDCAGAVVSNAYDAAGRLVRLIDANGISSSNAFDAAGRLVFTWRDGLLLSSNSYNAAGWVTIRRDANGLIISNAYDAVGHIGRVYMPDGSFIENVYSNTYLAQSIDRAGRSTRYERDVLGRVTNQVDNATNTVRYGYDAAGNLTDLYDQNGSRTRFVFDTEGRQTGKVYADGITNSYTHDAMGRLTAKVDGKAATTSYRYDAVGNLTNIDFAADVDVSFDYDALNRMTKMVDGVGTTLYAFVGSCTKVASVDGPFANDTVTYGYDDGKRLVAITSASSVVQYSLDSLDRIVSVVGRVDPNAPTTNTYAYLANGRIPDTLTHGNGVLTDYAYDPLFRLTNLVHQSGATNLASFAYTYNAADLRTSVVRGGSGSTPTAINYTYDPIGQLTAAQGDFPGYSFDYAFDPAGNPTRQNNNGLVMSNAFNNLNQNTTSLWSGLMTVLGVANITNGDVEVNGVAAALRAASEGSIFTATNLPVSTGTNTYTAVITDPFGRQDTNAVSAVAQNRGYGYDANGNMTNDGQFAYVWDNADRLKEVRTLAGALVMSCKYDGLGRRRERIVAAGHTDGPSTNRYVYHDWLVLEVRDGGTNVLESYTHGPDLSGTLGGAGGIGGILTCTSGSTNRWFHYDGNGNLIRATDASRAVVSLLEYGPFGTVLVRTGAYSPRYQFSSKEFDAAVELNCFGFRHYDPKTGRWLNRDPLNDKGGVDPSVLRPTPSARFLPDYLFVRNSPLNRWDALGLDDVGGVDPCKLPGVNPREDEGGVVCYKGKPHLCVWLPPTTDEWYANCIREHERTHSTDPEAEPCDPCKTHRQLVSADKEKRVECRGYGAGLACMRKALTAAGCDPDDGPVSWNCMGYYAAFRRHRDKARKEYGCSGGDFDIELPDE